jgi:hypothetical protein
MLHAITFMAALAMLVGACAPAAPVTVVVTAPPVVQTVEVPVQQTVVAAQTVVVNQTSAPQVITATPAPTTAGPQPTNTPAAVFKGLQDPKAVALAAAGGQKIGGNLDFLGV